MIDRVIKTVCDYSLFGDSRNVTVALSGGADSVALLLSLLEIKDKFGLEISASHFNHCLRGEESLRDEEFVRSLCEKLGVPVSFKSMDIAKYAKELKLSTELAARKARYAFFEEINKGVVATAHTADDNFETVLFNISRGTALKGLCGIPVKRDIYIRPLLFCTRNDIEEYLSKKGYTFVTDSTNLSDDYTRNKIRHNVVPVLKGINSAAAYKVADMSANLREDCDFLELTANAEFQKRYADGKLNVELFKELHPAILNRVIVNFLNKCGIEPNTTNISQMREFVSHKDGELTLSGGTVKKRGNFLLNGKIEETIPEFNIEIIEKNVNFPLNSYFVNNLLLKNCIDCDKIVGNIKVRTRAAGDKIRLHERHITKTLKKLFTELKVISQYRDKLPVIADDKGVIWVYGIGADDRVVPNDKTGKILFIETEKEVSIFE